MRQLAGEKGGYVRRADVRAGVRDQRTQHLAQRGPEARIDDVGACRKGYALGQDDEQLAASVGDTRARSSQLLVQPALLPRHAFADCLTNESAGDTSEDGSPVQSQPNLDQCGESRASTRRTWQDALLGDWRQEIPIMSLIHVSVIGHARRMVRVSLDRQSRPLYPSTGRNAMNWDQVEGKWKQVQGKVLEKWGKLTNDDLDQIAGKRDQLVGKVQEKYGLAKEAAEREVDEWTRGS